MVFGGFRLGQFRHFKKGAQYVAYDVTTDEASQREKVSYVRLSDGTKHSRFLEKFQDDVKDHADNETGQRQRFKLITQDVTFVINNRTATPTQEAVIENGTVVQPEVLGEQFTSMKEYLKANGIPEILPIKLGDKVAVPQPLVEDLYNTEAFTISGITNLGVYVESGHAHVFLPWHKLFSITLSFK
jgi:hypothetical protein